MQGWDPVRTLQFDIPYGSAYDFPRLGDRSRDTRLLEAARLSLTGLQIGPGYHKLAATNWRQEVIMTN